MSLGGLIVNAQTYEESHLETSTSYQNNMDLLSDEVAFDTEDQSQNSEYDEGVSGEGSSILPSLISISTDKEVYQAGETVYLTIIVDDASYVTDVYAEFTNKTHYGSTKRFKSTNKVVINYDGYHETVVAIEVAENVVTSDYYLSKVVIEDKYDLDLSQHLTPTVRIMGIEDQPNELQEIDTTDVQEPAKTEQIRPNQQAVDNEEVTTAEVAQFESFTKSEKAKLPVTGEARVFYIAGLTLGVLSFGVSLMLNRKTLALFARHH